MYRFRASNRVSTKVIAFGAALGLALTSTATFADSHGGDSDKAARAVEMRQSALHLLGFYMGPLGAMARGKAPIDMAVIENNATRIASLAPMLKETFMTDTRGAKVETEALDVIWEQWDKFTGNADTTATTGD